MPYPRQFIAETVVCNFKMKLTSRQLEFLNNLNQVINLLIGKESALESLKFKISLAEEAEKNKTSIDDIMSLVAHKDINFDQRIWQIDGVLEKLTAPNDKFPLWIEVRQVDQGIIELRCSTRFRRFSELQNKDQGFPPFKIV